jgi:hypothetical protein
MADEVHGGSLCTGRTTPPAEFREQGREALDYGTNHEKNGKD